MTPALYITVNLLLPLLNSRILCVRWTRMTLYMTVNVLVPLLNGVTNNVMDELISFLFL